MLGRIRDFFDGLVQAPDRPEARGADALQLAAAALMVEAALMNDVFDSAERDKIRALLRACFELAEDEVDELLDLAEARVAESNELYGFTRVVKNAYDNEERIALLEMLWQVVYADGELHDYEANLMRRITGLLHVTDRDSGAARKRALEQLRLES